MSARTRFMLVVCLLGSVVVAPAASGRQAYGPPSGAGSGSASTVGPPVEAAGGDETLIGSNPMEVAERGFDAMPGFDGGLAGALNVVLLLTVLTLVPTIMVMCTSFVRFVIVLGLLKQALGAGSMPPSQVITALALFMTALVMAPTFQRIHEEAIVPYEQGEVENQIEMWNRAKEPLRDYMFAQIEASENWSGVYMIMNYRGMDTSEPEKLTRGDVDMLTLIPSYMLSELKVAFLMGFKVYLPFLVIDMVIASLLISMSMMMLPPPLISLPFKLLLFILADGWQLVVGSLMTTIAQAEQVVSSGVTP